MTTGPGFKVARRDVSKGYGVAFGRRGMGRIRSAAVRDRVGASRTQGATIPTYARPAPRSFSQPQESPALVQIHPRRFKISVILLHNPTPFFRCLLPGEPTLAGDVLSERTAREIRTSKVGAPVIRACRSRTGPTFGLATAPGSMNGVGVAQHGIRSENGLAVRCASEAPCSLATLSTAHCASRTRWLGQIRKCPPWQLLA
jgi:hypothetical protein